MYKKPHEIVTAHDIPDLTPEVAAKAVRELLVENGWHQGAYRSEDGAFCLKGAIRYVYAFSNNFGDREQLATRIENLLYKRGEGDDAATWNDTPGRTKKQVLDILRSVEKGYGKST